MGRHAADHPTFETLQSYALGKLDDALAEAVNEHLGSCRDCRRQVADLALDTFLARLRDAQKVPAMSTSPGATEIPPAHAADRQTETDHVPQQEAPSPAHHGASPG
jgi:anti-sigma factor RsiW